MSAANDKAWNLLSEPVKTARAAVAWLAGWAVFLILLAIVVLTLLVETNTVALDEDPFILLTFIAAMIFFLRNDQYVSQEELTEKVNAAHRELSENISHAHEALAKTVAEDTRSMHQITSRIEAAQATIDKAVRQQSTSVRLMSETLHGTGELWTLERAMANLKPLLDEADPEQPIRFKHLGLSMTMAWEKLCPLLENLVVHKGRRIDFRLLILGTTACGAVPGANLAVPDDVSETWLPDGDKMRAKIERKLAAIAAAAVEAGVAANAFTHEVRSYRDLPVVHGMRVEGPFDAAFVALSRWSQSAIDPFWWGGDEYHRIFCPASHEQRDLMRVFDGYFDRWWEMNDPQGAAMSEGRSP